MRLSKTASAVILAIVLIISAACGGPPPNVNVSPSANITNTLTASEEVAIKTLKAQLAVLNFQNIQVNVIPASTATSGMRIITADVSLPGISCTATIEKTFQDVTDLSPPYFAKVKTTANPDGTAVEEAEARTTVTTDAVAAYIVYTYPECILNNQSGTPVYPQSK